MQDWKRRCWEGLNGGVSGHFGSSPLPSVRKSNLRWETFERGRENWDKLKSESDLLLKTLLNSLPRVVPSKPRTMDSLSTPPNCPIHLFLCTNNNQRLWPSLIKPNAFFIGHTPPGPCTPGKIGFKFTYWFSFFFFYCHTLIHIKNKFLKIHSLFSHFS